MAFLDKVLGRDERERELEKEIRSLELRKESVFAGINGEIGRLQNERTNVLLAAGTAAYDTWIRQNTAADLKEFWNRMGELDRQIAEQEKKRTEMGIKYDEEIQLIHNSMGVMTVNPPAPVGTGKQCPSCGTAVSDEDVFCQVCGVRLQ